MALLHMSPALPRPGLSFPDSSTSLPYNPQTHLFSLPSLHRHKLSSGSLWCQGDLWPLLPRADPGPASSTSPFPIPTPSLSQSPTQYALDACPLLSMPTPPLRTFLSPPTMSPTSSLTPSGLSAQVHHPLSFQLEKAFSNLAGWGHHPSLQSPAHGRLREGRCTEQGRNEHTHAQPLSTFTRTPGKLHPREKWEPLLSVPQSLLPGPGRRLPAPGTAVGVLYLIPYTEDFQINPLEFTARKRPSWISARFDFQS